MGETVVNCIKQSDCESLSNTLAIPNGKNEQLIKSILSKIDASCTVSKILPFKSAISYMSKTLCKELGILEFCNIAQIRHVEFLDFLRFISPCNNSK